MISRIEPTVGAYVEFVNDRRETLERFELAARTQDSADGQAGSIAPVVEEN